MNTTFCLTATNIFFLQIKEDYDNGCGGMALWILLLTSTSHVLLTINASMNFFLYCIMSTAFRNELLAWVGGASNKRAGPGNKRLNNGRGMRNNNGRLSNGGSASNANSVNGINKIAAGEKEKMIVATNV